MQPTFSLCALEPVVDTVGVIPLPLSAIAIRAGEEQIVQPRSAPRPALLMASVTR